MVILERPKMIILEILVDSAMSTNQCLRESLAVVITISIRVVWSDWSHLPNYQYHKKVLKFKNSFTDPLKCLIGYTNTIKEESNQLRGSKL